MPDRIRMFEPVASSSLLAVSAKAIADGQCIGLKLPHGRPVALALAKAGATVLIDNDRGVAHVAPGKVRRHG